MQHIKTVNAILIVTISIPLLTGCAITPLALDPVGPAPDNTQQSAYVPAGLGWLRLYTATRTVSEGDATYYYPHTGYRIYAESGKLLEFVPNHIDGMDESATLLKIPAGNYKVLARSEPYNVVIVPVVIQAGKTTEVHLGAHWNAPLNAPTNEIVYFPDGRPVGWKSIFTNSIH
jgi:hypothetical protein